MSEKMEWKVTRAAVPGLSHLAANIPCQDKVAVAPIQSGVNCYAAALADGVGSLQNSHIAAKVATDAALAWLIEYREQLFSEDYSKEKSHQRLRALVAQMVEKIRQEIREQAELQGMDVRSMDCNLAFCLVDEDQGKALAGQLGDCAVCIVCDDSDMSRSRVLNQQGMLANSTDTVQSAGSENRVNLCVIPLAEKGPKGNRLLYGFILTSDGLENVLYRKGSKYVCKQAEYCFNLDSNNRTASLQALLADAQESSKGYLDDDMSVVVLSCVDGPISLPKEPYWICKECGAENMGIEPRCHKCGAEVLSMFPREDIEKAGSAEAYFEWLNRREAAAPAATRKTKEGKAEKQSRKNKRETKTKSNATIDFTDGEAEVKQTGKTGMLNNLSRIGAGLSGVKPLEANGNDEGGYVSAGGQQQEYREDADVEERRTGLVTKIITGVLVVAVVCLAVLLAVVGIKYIRGDTPPTTTEPQVTSGQTTQPTERDENDDPQPSGEGIRLDNGTVFFGELLNGMPNGWGTLMDEVNNTVYTGSFRMGMKDGVFTVTTYEDREVMACVVLYQDDVLTDIYYGEMENSKKEFVTVGHDVRLYKEPNYDANPVQDTSGNIVRLREGDSVYLLKDQVTDVIGNKWCQIETTDGIIGWCEDTAIVRIIREESEAPEIWDNGDSD